MWVKLQDSTVNMDNVVEFSIHEENKRLLMLMPVDGETLHYFYNNAQDAKNEVERLNRIVVITHSRE